MKHFYSAIAATMMLAAGAMNAEARFWTYDYQTNVDAASIQPGVWYCLQGGQSFLDGGYTAFLSGELHSTSQNLTTDNLYQFEPTGETTEDGATVYYLKRYDGTYLYATGQANFYGPAVDRAWKIAVRDAKEAFDPEYTYGVENEETGETDELTGMAAYVAEAKANNEEFNLYDATYCGAEYGLVFAAAAADDATDPYSTYTYLLGLGAGAKTGSATRGTDYNKNTWVIFPATEQSAQESLEAIIFEITNGSNDLDLSEYQLGDGAGEYSKELYNTFMELWEKAQAVINGEASLSDAEIDDVAEKLKPALEAFKNSGKGLSEGYYILRSMRPRADWTSAAYPWGRNGSGYDDGAIYDGSVVNPSDANLRWSYKAEDKVEFYLNELDKTAYETAKFVWKATKSGNKDKDGNDLYYFQNIETEKYIGKDPKTYSPVVMHDTPQVDFTIAANPNFPGWFSFYSPELTVASEDANYPADYSGLHCSSDVNNVVAWDWRVGGSCWKVETLTEDEVEMLRDNLAGPQRLNKAKALVAQYEEYMAKGYSYDGYNADGTKSEYAKTGSLELDGLVTSAEQIACPMNETSEGSMEALFDSDKGTYMHSTWSASWKGDHYLEMTIEQPETDLLFKWVKRFVEGNPNNNGAPLNVVIWGTNNEADLELNQAEGAETAEQFNDWQNTWKELGKATFEYTLAVEGNEKANAVGFASVKLSEPVKYIRMAVKTRVADGDLPKGNKYFHGSEFRLYKSVLNMEESLISAVPDDVVTALQNAVKEANDAIADGEVSEELLNRLQAALDKFIEFFPEPAKLTDAITKAKTLTENAMEGEGLGYYEQGAIAALEKAIAEAEAKVKPVMTLDEINNALAALAAAVDAYNAALHVPASGLYVIKSESENEKNTGRAITATYSSTTDAMNHRGGAAEANSNLRPGSYWMVEKVDGGYTYKNLYTGRYLAPVGTKRDLITQSDEPYVFGISFAKTPGCFNITIPAEDAYNGDYFYANVQPGTGNLVTWNAAEGRDNSAFSFHVQSVEEVDAKLAESGMLFDVYYPGAAQFYTFPVDMDTYVEGEAGAFYSVIGQDSQNNIQLKALAEGTVLKAGQAYIYVPAEDNTDATALFYMPRDVELSKAEKTTTVKNENGLCGVFESQELVAGLGVFATDHTKVLVSEEGDVAAAGTGYFSQMPKTDVTGDLTLVCNGEIVTEAGITAVIDNRKADNSIYTISGVRMNSMKNLPAGLYIIGGKKYIVK